jgi:putative chitinase
MIMVTLKNLQVAGIKAAVQDEVMTKVIPLLPEYAIDTPQRVAHFMAQVCHESNGFSIKQESLRYKDPSRLIAVWPKRFASLAFAQQYVNDEQKLGNYVYGNRMGNGGPETNDGYTFRGRGPMQTTGKENYKRLSQKIFGDDRLLTNPDLLLDLQYGILAALIEWKEGGCNAMADKDQLKEITQRINGGLNGIADRGRWLEKWKRILLPVPV